MDDEGAARMRWLRSTMGCDDGARRVLYGAARRARLADAVRWATIGCDDGGCDDGPATGDVPDAKI